MVYNRLINSDLKTEKREGWYALNNRAFCIQKHCQYFSDVFQNSAYTMYFDGHIFKFLRSTYPCSWMVWEHDDYDGHVPRRVTPLGRDPKDTWFTSIVSPYDHVLIREDPEDADWFRGKHEVAYEMLHNYPAYILSLIHI